MSMNYNRERWYRVWLRWITRCFISYNIL